MGKCCFRKLDHGEIELLVDYGVERQEDSWLEEIDSPVMLVTGAGGFIGRYMVDLLVNLGYHVFATDIGVPPRYLKQEKFSSVEYAPADLREEGEVFSLLRRVKPAAVFHIGAIFDFSAPEELLHEVNVVGTERVCEAARESGARRLVYWSTGSIYAPSQEPLPETSPKSPADPYAKSKLGGEETAFSFHDAPHFEVYSIRPAMVSGVLSRYGSGLIMRLMYEGYLVGPPQRKGMMSAVVNARDVAACGYLIGARRLELPSSSIDDTAFNASADPVDVDEMMKALGELLPRRQILGVHTKLAEVISFGYQEEVRLPDKFVEFVGMASELLTGALNRFRLAKLHPKIPPEGVPYFTEARNMSNEKAKHLLGWKPDSLEADLEETVRFYEETGWRGFERRSSVEAQRYVRGFDEVKALTAALGTRAVSERCPRVEVPSLGIEIDGRSLRVLVRSAEVHIMERAYEGRLSELVGGALPRLASQAVEDAALYLKYAYLKAYDDGAFPERDFVTLLRRVRSLDKDAVASWVLASNLARFIEKLLASGENLRLLSELLPNGRYGLLVETEFDDVAIELQKDASHRAVHFPREETDSIPGHLPLEERAERLKKLRGMKLAVGVPFGVLVEILSGRTDFGACLDSFAWSPPEVLERLSRKMKDPGWSLLLFEDEEGKLVVGLELSGRLSFCSREKLEALDLGRTFLPEGGIVRALEEASSGRERAALYKVEEFRDLIADAIAPGIVSRIFGR